MGTDYVLIGSVLCVVGTVAVLGYLVFRGIQQINQDAERNDSHNH